MDMEGFRKNNTVLKRFGMHMNTAAPFSIQLKSTVRICPAQGRQTQSEGGRDGEVIRMGGRCRPVHIINGEIYGNQKIDKKFIPNFIPNVIQ